MLEQRERLRGIDLLDTIIQAFVQLAEPAKTPAPAELREILMDSAATLPARVAAANAVGSLRDIASIPALLAVSTNEQRETGTLNVRVAAIRSLGVVGVQLRESGKSTTDIETLLRSLIDPHAETEETPNDILDAALNAFAKVADSSQAEVLFRWTVHPRLRVTGIYAVSAMLQRDPEQTGPIVRQFLEWCASQQDLSMVPDDVIVGMHHHGVEISPETKAEAITAAVSTLREALADPDERVRTLAKRWLEGLSKGPVVPN